MLNPRPARILAAALLLPVLAACSGTTSPPAASPAEVLRAWDADNTHAPTIGTLADYQTALNKVTPKCTNDPAKIPAMVEATYGILAKNGITDETTLTLLGHLDQSIPDGTPAMDCVGVLAAYATLREG